MQRTRGKRIKRKLKERILSVFLVMAMLVTFISPVTTQAQTKKQKMTFYVGEEYGLRDESYTWRMLSASSSNKKVATIKLDKGDPFKYTIKAKKAGTTTLTISGKTFKNKSKKVQITLTVKKPDITFKTQGMNLNYKLVALKNKTNTTFDSITYQYTFKNSAGQVVAQDTDTAYDVMAGKTTYQKVTVINDDIDYSKSTFKITGYNRSPDWTYKVANDEQLSVKMVNVEKEGPYTSFNYKIKSKVNQRVKCIVYIIYYDANDRIVAVEQETIYLDKKESVTRPEKIIYKPEEPDRTFDHFEMIYQGYCKYNK